MTRRGADSRMPGVLAGQPPRRMRDSNSRGVAPNTLSKYAPEHSCQAGVVRDLGGLQLAGSADAREPRRMRLRMRLGPIGRIDSREPGPRHRATPDERRACAPETVAPRRAGADRHQAGPVGGITLSDRGIRGERAPTRLMYVWRLLGAGRQRCAYVADLRTSRSVLPPLGCERLLRRVCDATAIPRWVLRLSAARPGC